jgi:predicted HAD superfamily Cof-like phosphohydrolase
MKTLDEAIAAVDEMVGRGSAWMAFAPRPEDMGVGPLHAPGAFVVVMGSPRVQNIPSGGTGFAMALSREELTGHRDEVNELLGEQTLTARVTEFHLAMAHPIATTPWVPPAHRVRLRGRLVAEECIELLTALFPDAGFGDVLEVIMARIATSEPRPNLPAVADALADIAYVNEGTNIEFGIDGNAVMVEVHRANMAKAAGGKDEHGKQIKPEGWQPPDIAGVLARQGYKP